MNNNEVINLVLQKLFEAEKRRLAGIITELNSSNKRLNGHIADGFLYGGQLFMPSGVSTVVAGPGQCKPTLHFSLNNEMDAYTRDLKTVKDDHDLIRQMLFLLLKPCTNEREVRNTLPECLVSLVQGLNNEPRADNAGYTLRGDHRAMRQFAKLVPKMEIYSVGRLLY